MSVNIHPATAALEPLGVTVGGASPDAIPQLSAALNETAKRPIAITPIGEGIAGRIFLLIANATDGINAAARQHMAMAHVAGFSHLIIALDLAGRKEDGETQYNAAAAAVASFAQRFPFATVATVPFATDHPATLFNPQSTWPWFAGEGLLSHLQLADAASADAKRPLRLLVQSVDQTAAGRKTVRGRIASGTLKASDTVCIARTGSTHIVADVVAESAEPGVGRAGQDVSVHLDGNADVVAEDVFADPNDLPQFAQQFVADVAWLADEPLLPGRDYDLRLVSRTVIASVTAVKFRVNVETLYRVQQRLLKKGEIGACTIATAIPIAVDDFVDFPETGRFVLVDRYTGRTIGAGTVDFALRRGSNIHPQTLVVTKAVRASIKKQRPCIIWFTGLSGSGKSTISNLVEYELAARGVHTYILDGDNVRYGLNKDLGFTAADRVENIRRVGEVAKLFVDAGTVVLCSFISPFRAERATIRGLVAKDEFIEAYVQTPIEICEKRDPKGLYAKARAGKLPNFTGIDSPYEVPERPEIVLDTKSFGPDILASRVIEFLRDRGIIPAAKS
jgi:bifunctional enzyme CysN/CysC